MKQKYGIFYILLTVLMNVLNAQEISIERVINPTASFYQPLFLKFGQNVCSACCDQQTLQSLLIDEFNSDMNSYQNNAQDRLFLQALLDDEIVGYLSCQVISDQQVQIHQLIMNLEKYDSDLVKELLFAVFASMPKIKELSIQVLTQCSDLVELLEYFGFEKNDNLNEAVAAIKLFSEFKLHVHPKCKMCEILYGSDFWEIEIDPAEDGFWGSYEVLGAENEPVKEYALGEDVDDLDDSVVSE